jgi:hypothetical protein
LWNPLPDVLNFYDYDYIKSQFDGQSPPPLMMTIG